MIYIVEDDESIRDMEIYALKSAGYSAVGFEDGKTFLEALEQRLPRLVLLDIMLPGEDGLSLLKTIRLDHRTRSLPVIMVTAKDTELDMVRGLDGGADDYIAKPFGIMELLSRVKALLRRTEKEPERVLSFREICLNDDTHTVTTNGTECILTYKEYVLLKYLMENPGMVLSRDRIMDRVWETDFEGESRTVDMHIKTLRKKLGNAGKYIQTVRNVGYKIGEVNETKH